MNTESLRGKLLNIAREKDIPFQEFLNRFGSEQFLARLSQSPYAAQFVFKCGTLLTYLIETDRRTRDLDFSIRQISNKTDETEALIAEILAITLDDGLSWEPPQGETLEHPEMDYPGVRIKCPFRLGKAKGMVRIDLAIGDAVEAHKVPLVRIRYKGKPLMGDDFDVLMYPPETIFSEKLQTALARRGANTRMKDYYDMYQLSFAEVLDAARLKKSIKKTFAQRGTAVQTVLDFDDDVLGVLQRYWEAFIRKMELTEAPKQIKDVVDVINQQLQVVYGDG
jgi:predicted nucleotidyltransferase component of viral defense system